MVTFKLLRGPFEVPLPWAVKDDRGGALLTDGYDLTIAWVDDRTGKLEEHPATGSIRYLTRIWHLSGFTVEIDDFQAKHAASIESCGVRSPSPWTR